MSPRVSRGEKIMRAKQLAGRLHRYITSGAPAYHPDICREAARTTLALTAMLDEK